MKGQQKDRLGAEAQEAIRIRLIQYLQSRKGTQKEAAAIFMLSLSAVKKIWKRYKQHGDEGSKAHKRGPEKDSGSRLSPTEVQPITTLIKGATPDQYDLSYPLWTASAVRELIKKRPR